MGAASQDSGHLKRHTETSHPALHPVVVVGAGMAGLSCAVHLQRAGVRCVVFDAASKPGGRLRTDSLDGFLLDRGFQVFQTAYPSAKELFSYPALDLNPFKPGSLIRKRRGVAVVADPYRCPDDFIPTLLAPVGSLRDKWLIRSLRQHVLKGSLESLFRRPEQTSARYLERFGFSQRFIESFFRPFFGGVFLENNLETSSRHLEFVFRMLAEGSAALPARGIGAIPEQLASHLKAGVLQLNSPVQSVARHSVTLADGETVQASAVILAVEGADADRLLGDVLAGHQIGARAATTLYYAAPKPPYAQPMLMLNGEETGWINHLAVLTNVAPSYAPAGQALISVTVLGNPPLSDVSLEAEVQQELQAWFGASVVAQWRFLRMYRVLRALPERSYLVGSLPVSPGRHASGVYLCGDYTQSPSLHGALVSGAEAAKAVLAHLLQAGEG
jgi:phytoene dehydrogenase-like protein